jgi:hypothetical protein
MADTLNELRDRVAIAVLPTLHWRLLRRRRARWNHLGLSWFAVGGRRVGAAIVVKDYVSKARRVLLCDDTCRLLESLGFTVFERTRCHLVKRQSQPGLFGWTIEKKTERKSFFRRLHEKKLAPDDERRIDWEEVIWARS